MTVEVALEWAEHEAKTDRDYWKDRAKNGSGLIKQIANFVIKQGRNDKKR